MGWWILGFLAVFALIAVIVDRRGSTGASRADDLPSGRDRHTPDSGYGGGGPGGGGLGGDGGF
jgi:hypothetical protein